ncbi:acetate--CoA ligase [Nocardioides mesophilus]|uniref:acetate--CoA ligase n=1 Tax=Nocardioides mesophilus TaxID=433659 RepID=UPI001FE4D712|nr:acetate--CoA ligase [Nocardioides mesophilus]
MSAGHPDRSQAWALARAALDGLPGGGLNIAYEAVDRHVVHGDGDVVALRCLAADGAVQEHTYRDLREHTNRFAAVLDGLGVKPGGAVFTLLGRGWETHVSALGTLKHASVFCPLFAAFGPEPVRQRMLMGRARVLVTTRELYRRRIAGLRDQLPELAEVLLVDADPTTVEPGTRSWHDLMATADADYTIPWTDPESVALLHFTSGTTGRPKGALHVHDAVVAHHATAGHALGLRRGDVFWCTADPGWVTGTSYGIIAPLTHGATVVVDAGDFDARRWYGVLADQRVSVWYTAPTALRMLMRSGAELAGRYDLSALRHVASVGEPLNAEAVLWAQETFRRPVLDNWWQTETGAIMVSNAPGDEVRPGSMGRPEPGVEVALLERGTDGRPVLSDGQVVEVSDPRQVGELALRPGWPSMFRGYLDDEERYRRCFIGGWYCSGDLARRDVDGYYWFVGRGDDVIKSAGHLIGPFEVESALMEHPAVVEAGVIGKPDPVAGELVKAFVTLRPGFDADEQLRRELVAFGRRRLGSVAPREIVFDQHLPHTRSGKVMRRLLKARELGLPEGDVSTLERQ